MNTRNLLLAVLIVGFASCTTAYKAGQMPDDVYYSPGQERGGGYVAVQTDQDRSAYRGQDNDAYTNNDEDSYLRMRVRNPRRWSAFDDYYFNSWQYNTWGGGFNNWYNPLWSSWSWNSYYFNPYFSPFYWNNYYYHPGYFNPIVIGKPIRTNPRANGPRQFNLNNYGNRTVANPYVDPKQSASGNYNNGRAPVRIFRNNDNDRGYAPRNSSSAPTRSFESRGSSNSGSSGSSNRGGGGGTAPVRTFPRGGR